MVDIAESNEHRAGRRSTPAVLLVAEPLPTAASPRQEVNPQGLRSDYRVGEPHSRKIPADRKPVRAAAVVRPNVEGLLPSADAEAALTVRCDSGAVHAREDGRAVRADPHRPQAEA